MQEGEALSVNKRLTIYVTEDGLILQRNDLKGSTFIHYSDIVRARYIHKKGSSDLGSLVGGLTMLALSIFLYYTAAQFQIPLSGGLLFVIVILLIIGILSIIAGFASSTKHRLILHIRGLNNPVIIDGNAPQIAELFNIIKNKLIAINSQYVSSLLTNFSLSYNVASQPQPTYQRSRVQTTIAKNYEELEVRPFMDDDQTVVKG